MMKNMKNVNKIKKEIKNMSNNFEDYLKSPEHIKSIQESALSADKIALLLRQESIEASGTYVEQEPVITSNSPHAFKYFIGKIWNNSIIFTLPALLNFRVLEKKNNQIYVKNFNLVNNDLVQNFFDFYNETGWEAPKGKSILAVFNVVALDTPKYFISDSDNRYYSELNNVVKQFFTLDDSYQYLSFYYDTIQFGNENKTVCILITPEDRVNAFDHINSNLFQLLEPEKLDLSNNKIIKFDDRHWSKTQQK